MNTGNGRRRRSGEAWLDLDRLETILAEVEAAQAGRCGGGGSGLARWLGELLVARPACYLTLLCPALEWTTLSPATHLCSQISCQ